MWGLSLTNSSQKVCNTSLTTVASIAQTRCATDLHPEAFNDVAGYRIHEGIGGRAAGRVGGCRRHGWHWLTCIAGRRRLQQRVGRDANYYYLFTFVFIENIYQIMLQVSHPASGVASLPILRKVSRLAQGVVPGRVVDGCVRCRCWYILFNNATLAFYNWAPFKRVAAENAAFLNSLPPFLDGRPVYLEDIVR